MAKFTFPNQSNYGWVQTFNMGAKVPIVSKRIFDTYDNALAFVNDPKDTAIPGIYISVIKDSDTKKNGAYYVVKAAGFDSEESGELMKMGDGAKTILVNTYAEAQALATAETIGQLIYLTKEDSVTTPEVTYAVSLYVVTGASTLEKICATSSSSGNIEEDLRAHTSNGKIHVPDHSEANNGQVLKVVDGSATWANEYTLPEAGDQLGGVKTGGDVTISKGQITVNDGKFIKMDEKGTANGVATLNEDGKIPVSQIDGAMAKVFGIEKAVENQGALPPEATKGQRYYTIDTKKIYEKTSDSWSEPIDPKADTIYNFRHSDKTGSEGRSNILYRWDGEDMVEISASIALGETSGTAYEGNKGKANADAIAAIKEYTVNGKKISEAPVLSGADIALDGYDGTIAEAADTVNEGIKKLAAEIDKIDKKSGVVSLGGKTGTVTITSTAPGQIEINGTEEGATTVPINGWDNKADKATVDGYTVNGKTISSNPTLSGADIALTGYALAEEAADVADGDTVNVAMGKLQKKLNENIPTALSEDDILGICKME